MRAEAPYSVVPDPFFLLGPPEILFAATTASVPPRPRRPVRRDRCELLAALPLSVLLLARRCDCTLLDRTPRRLCLLPMRLR